MSLHAGPTPGRPFGSSAPPSVCDVIGSAPPPAFKSRVSAEGVQSVGGSRSWSVVWGPPPVSGRVVLDFPFLGSLLELPRGSLPERSLPERSLPERSLPERSLPERSLPERSLPGLPCRTVPERLPRSGCYSAQDILFSLAVRRSSVCQVVVQKCGVSVRVKKPTVKFAALQGMWEETERLVSLRGLNAYFELKSSKVELGHPK
ncbi:uncharacterized protein LOC112533472 isoform X3, partial [Gallus gallus]|uniref:uncharacterized protein LOC112533472 isoform X3 n=1 Tax=Gallus gallus TaxID=9031 RepID=UPI001AE533B2